MPRQINWSSIYKGFSASATKIDCGSLCAGNNGGVPVCCSNNLHVPLLFSTELQWHIQNKNSMWKKRVSKTKLDKKQEAECSDHLVYCHCDGARHCKRSKRSLTCRFFPFEPYISEGGVLIGITYMYRAKKDCPLIDNPDAGISKAYIRQAIKTWKLVFEQFPEEFDLYYENSRMLQRSFKRKQQTLKVFTLPRTIKKDIRHG